LTVAINKGAPSWDENTFVMQQMNIFLQKDFSTELSSFASLEFTNSFNSNINVGGIQVEEAWLKYSPSSAFNVKAGQLVPKFNNLNEIKNRTVLLPYIYRPLVYETVFNSQFGNEEFIPLYANLEIYGDVTVGNNMRFNYAAYMGNLSTENLIKNTAGLEAGNDSSRYKMFGGRLGVEYGNLSVGVSGTYDRKNLWAYNIGYVPRERFGAYLNYSIARFELEAEYIRVYNDLSTANKIALDSAIARTPGTPTGFNKYYMHVNLLYNITDQLFAYAGYDYLQTQDNTFSKSGLKQPAFGAGYKVNDSIVLKGEYTYQGSTIGTMKVDRNDYLLAASVYF